MKFALIGCGRIGKRHAEIMSEYGDLVAVCDIDFNKAVKFGKKHKALAYQDVYDCVSSSFVDLVAICTPNGLHASHTITALNYSNVLVEKPMALTKRDCERMIHKAEISNKRLFVVKQNRYNPPVKAVKELIDKGKLGNIYSIALNCYWNRNKKYYNESDWKGTIDLDGGTLYTQFSHFVDLLYWMFGDPISIESDMMQFNNIHELEDAGVCILQWSNGALGTIHYTVNAKNKNMEGSLTIFAEKATIKIGGQYLNELEYQEPVLIKNLPPGNPPNNYGAYIGSMSNHELVYDNIIEVLESSGQVTTSCMDGLKTVEIIERIYK